MRIQVSNPEVVVKRAFYLAWKACGGAMGMGWFQDRGEQSEDQVWDGVYNRSDYPGGSTIPGFSNEPGRVYGDYVFGRMMKLGIEWDQESVTVTDAAPRRDYQGWCGTYPTYADLIEAAVKSLK